MTKKSETSRKRDKIHSRQETRKTLHLHNLQHHALGGSLHNTEMCAGVAMKQLYFDLLLILNLYPIFKAKSASNLEPLY